jgi:hypothetical protein
MKTINVSDFPKYKKACQNDEYDTWEESVRANGCKSARADLGNNYFGNYIIMSDADYTWFILRWS